MTEATSRPMSRRKKIGTLVPVALVSVLWTASLVTTSASADEPGSPGTLPDGTTVPTQAIEAPASIPVPGIVAPAVPEGSADSVVAGASSNGIPAPALAAYQRAAQIINAADKSCNISWALVAAIGRVESDHGRYGGNTLSKDGVSTPGIFGMQLNGKNGTQAINDTDAGELDRDTVFDRAVGPMQFIPSTWEVVKVDADGDGKRNPQDIDDAGLATAVYLCSGSENLGQRKGQEAAVYRYNHSREYVNLVLRLMEAYDAGDYTAVPSGTYGGTTFSPSYTSTIAERRQAAKTRAVNRSKKTRARSSNSGSSSSSGTSSTSKPTTPGDAATSSPAPAKDPGKAVADGVKKTTDGVKKTVEGTVKDPVGTVTKTLTRVEATTRCLGQAGVSGVTQLLTNPGAKNIYVTCMGNLGFPQP